MCVEGIGVNRHLNSAIPLAKLDEGSVSQASDKACTKSTPLWVDNKASSHCLKT